MFGEKREGLLNGHDQEVQSKQNDGANSCANDGHPWLSADGLSFGLMLGVGGIMRHGLDFFFNLFNFFFDFSH